MENLLDYGYWGLFLGSFLSATIIPFSSDILLLGMLMLGGDIYVTVIVATVGNWLGGLLSYYMGFFGKWEWIEKWFRVKEETLLKQKKLITKYGSSLAFLSWLPLVGDVFAIGLGFYKTNQYKTSVFMFLGKGTRFVLWALLYHYIGFQGFF
ncbi:MAG: DedA family protein [Bacteroidetes bacterium]|nr:DedA family protein [Bacteroidota bacterium]